MVALCAALGLCALASPASPAHAVDGVDLQLSVSGVTFGAGSTVVPQFTITNAGTANATGVTVTLDLISTGSSPALTFIPQYNGCTMANSAEVRCPAPDIAASGTYTNDFATGAVMAKAIEAHPVAGSSTPVPMAMKAKITVAAQQPDLNPADNQVTVDPIMRTVRSGPTDFSAEITSLNRLSATEFSVDAAFPNNGPNQSELAEMTETVTAPPGTQWETSSGGLNTCAPLVASVKYFCNTQSSIPVGQSAFFQAKLLVTGGPLGVGEVDVMGMGGDPNLNNNSAKIDLTPWNPPSTRTPTPTPAPQAPSTSTPTTGPTPTPVNTTKIAVVAEVGASLARRDTGR
jgi:hypothetical protein